MKIVRCISKAVLAVILACLLWGCSSGLNAYRKGDYYKASMQATNRLRSNPDKQKARDALTLAYPLAVDNALRMVDNALVSRETQKLDRTIGIYEDMNRLAQEIRTCPAALEIVPNPVEFHEELRMSKKMMADIFFKEAVGALNHGTLEQARIAYRKFLKVREYAPSYDGINEALEKARYAATLRVLVVPPVTNNSYFLSAEFFYNMLMEDISGRRYKNLVRFYTPQEARALNMNNPHELLLLNFEDFTVGNTREVSDSYELTKDNVVVSSRYVNGRRENVYGTVKAYYSIHRREIMSRGVLSVRILDPGTKKVVRHRNFAGQSVWQTEWATFNGDDRALSSEQLALTKKKPAPQPSSQEMFASFANPLYGEATQYIGSLY